MPPAWALRRWRAVSKACRVDRIPPAYLAKGIYFSCSVRAPFSRLIYPVPEPGGLGVHLTLDLAGQARFGPDVEWIEIRTMTSIRRGRPSFTRRSGATGRTA